ncbi:glycosyltransferase family 4 protein [Sphaerospermopsis aphanizomenoides BCCUSP55]|uniref:glycosyltransferase family 4 protein n=1 Tax=Sphaerospermopsis aphanizomenoides TaxID=459663 RepID=UPI00190902DD|nr:glycosyltransferase family 4 protein [Sphaerospermopsis aphanizomenoides]MBK1987116.1 glycosyltransferase family 4 protein [Sphaerospermopsis aphanizomenoides BCCUSP55]
MSQLNRAAIQKIKVNFYSILPSPYQRDLFFELSRCPEIDLTVYYLEPSCADSPWPEKPLQHYEHILPGFHLAWGLSRFHFNWHFPSTTQADVVVLNGYMNLTTQLLLRLQAKKIPCIFWGEKMVGSSEGIKGKLQKYLADSLRYCRAIAAIGTKAQQDYQLRFPNQPIFNIPYYCDLTAFSQNLPQRPRNPVTILFCGQMIGRKGVDILLQAFNHLIQSGYNARLLLVGREAELPQLLETLPAQTRQKIEYAGFQSPENLPEFFHQADLFVLPSRYDGWGVVVNQAIGAGLPVICSDGVGAGYDLVKPGENGNLFPNGNTEALAGVLIDYLQQPDTIKVASAGSMQKATELSPAIGAQRWVEVFQKLTGIV